MSSQMSVDEQITALKKRINAVEKEQYSNVNSETEQVIESLEERIKELESQLSGTFEISTEPIIKIVDSKLSVIRDNIVDIERRLKSLRESRYQ